MTKNDTIASRLISRRAELGLSQNQLAMKAKIAPAQISRYESETNKPSVSTLGKLSSVLGVNFEWLAYGRKPKLSCDYDDVVSLRVEIPKKLYDDLNKEARELGIDIDAYVNGLLNKQR